MALAPAALIASPPAEAWDIGPIVMGRNYSVGMPAHPQAAPGGAVRFAFPQSGRGQVDAMTTAIGPLDRARTITIRYRVDAAPGTRFVADETPITASGGTTHTVEVTYTDDAVKAAVDADLVRENHRLNAQMVLLTIAISGGPFKQGYNVLKGVDRFIPVDVYIPGCPPRPEAIIDGVLRIQDLIGKESLRRRNSDHYKALLESYGIQ